MAKDSSNPEAEQESRGTPPKDVGKRNRNMVRTGVAVGIGSAAIVAALLYANRGRKGDRGEG